MVKAKTIKIGLQADRNDV